MLGEGWTGDKGGAEQGSVGYIKASMSHWHVTDHCSSMKQQQLPCDAEKIQYTPDQISVKLGFTDSS